MSKFEYFHVFETILYGLMVGKLIIGINNLYTFRSGIRFYWPYFLLIISVFLVVVNSYHDNLGSPLYSAVKGEWFFLHVIIIPPLILYSIIHNIFPVKLKKVDLRDFLLHRNRRVIFLLGTIAGIYGIYRTSLQWGLEQQTNAMTAYVGTLKEAWFIIPHLLYLLYLMVAIWENEQLLKITLILSLLGQIVFYII